MRHLLALVLMALIGFLGCQDPQKIESEDRVISVEIEKAQKAKYSDFIDSIEYLQLKVPQNEFVGNVSRVFFAKGNIGVVDERGSCVWIFTDKGEYVNKIDVVIGQGPGEFLTLSDAVFGEDGEVHILGVYRVNTVDFEGNLLEERQLPVLARTFEYLNRDSSFVTFMNNSISGTPAEDSLMGFNLYSLDNKGKIVDRFIPFKKNKSNLQYLSRANFYSFENTVHHYSFLDENIYQVLNSNKVKVKYRLDYQNTAISESVFEERENYDNGIDFMREEIEGQGYSRLRSFMETSNFLVIDISYDDESGYLFYNKRTDKSIFTSWGAFSNDFIPEMKVYFHRSYNDHIFGISSVSRIQNLAKKKESSNENLITLLSQISENEGPILIKAKLK